MPFFSRLFSPRSRFLHRRVGKPPSDENLLAKPHILCRAGRPVWVALIFITSFVLAAFYRLPFLLLPFPAISHGDL